MSAANQAVFLSYASQDAEAAQRICESLRQAGVEVWFDVEGGLETGDEWDAKIRKQIKECVLFIPVISATTQARHEGYFRIEWELAAQRAMGIASGVPFILPVVIDDTREPDALVPDRFRMVQWTRLPGGVVTPEVKARYLKLWSHRTGALKQAAPQGAPASSRSSDDAGKMPALLKARWLVPSVAGVALLLVVALWQPWRSAAPLPAVPPTALTPPVLSEARQLIAKAWVQLKKPEMGRAELEAAELLCKKAADLDPADAEVWATWTQVHAWMMNHRFDSSATRREAAQNCVARAIRLDATSYEVRLAQAIVWDQGATREGQSNRGKRLRELVQERPDDWRAAHELAQFLMRPPETRAEGIALLERMAQNPEHAALAWMDLGWFHWNRTKDMRKALEAAEKSVAVQPFWHNLGLKASLAAVWLGDLDLALATAQRLKPADRQEDWAVALFNLIYQMRREPKELIKFLNTVHREWISSNAFTGPKAALTGWARAEEGEKELARRDFRRGLDLVEQRLAVEPNDGRLLAMKITLLFGCGDEAEARKNYEIYQKLGLRSSLNPFYLMEPKDRVMERLEANPPLAADLRLHPEYDSLRSHPRFAALQAKVDADPRKSPHAPQPAAGSESNPPKK